MKRGIFLSGYVLLMFLHCARDYNPFSDVSNARVHIVSSPDLIDTLPIFTTDTVKLVFTVCNMIEKVSVEVKNNRFSNPVYNNVCSCNGSATVPVSFYDTGFQEVRIVTYLKYGEPLVNKKQYYVVSMLKQDDITGNYGSVLNLKANTNNPDQDRDVKYIWKIGKEKTVKSFIETASTAIFSPLTNEICTLKISDRQEKYTSPYVLFRVSLSDTLKPDIVIMNPISNDTIYIPGDTLLLQIQIEKSVSKNTVYANGAMMTDIGSNYFIHTISRENAEREKRVRIVADAALGKESDKTVYIVFNSAVFQYVKPHIEIIGHPGDEMVNVLQKNYHLNGRVVFNANAVVKYSVLLFKGDLPLGRIDTSGTETFPWNFMLNLDEDHNFYRIELRDSLANVIQDTTLHISYCAHCVDTLPPVIASILVNKDTLTSSYRYTSNSRNVSIELICFDLGIGVHSVLIGNEIMTNDISANYRWIRNVTVSHILNPDTIIFRAVDSNGIRSEGISIVIGYNTNPYFKLPPDSICHAFIGTTYTDTIIIGDDDPHDYVRYSVNFRNIAPGSRKEIFIDENGRISWIPENSDLGFNDVRLTGTDRNGAQVSFNYSIYVSDVALDTVKFLTSGKDFPKILSCKDSLIVPLRVTGGTRPVKFEIRGPANKGEIKINSNDTVFRWKPEIVVEPVNYQFFIVVRDFLGIADTLWPVITITPENRAFEVVEKYWTGDTRSDTILDLSGIYPDTLCYVINDPDSPLFEKHTIEVESGSEKYLLLTDSSVFFILLDPSRKKTGYDSICLTITDKGGYVQNIRKYLYYGYPPTVSLRSPADGKSVESKEVRFSWSATDPDNDTLMYEFSLFFNDGTALKKRTEIMDTFFNVSELKKEGIYYWNVVAHDSKSSVESSTGIFSYIPPDRVRFDTLFSKLPEMIKCNDTAIAPITIKYGYPPFNTTIVRSVQNNKPQIRNDSIIWIPGCFQTGRQFITLEVKDSVGNKDEFSFYTSIYGSDSLSVSLVNKVPRNTNGEIDLGNPMIKEVVCTLSINDPDPTPPDSFTIDFMLGNVRQEFYSKSVDRFIILTLRSSPVKSRETLFVKVTEMSGINYTYIDSLYYGN